MIGRCVRHAERRELGRDVRGLHAVVAEVAAERAVEQIRPALHDEVHPEAAGRLRDVLAGRRDLDFLEVVEVEVGRRRAGERHVGDDDAVERPDGVLRPRALHREVRLLAGFVAADVDAVHEHAGHRTHERERIAAGRDLRQLVGGDVRGRPGLLPSTIGVAAVTVTVSVRPDLQHIARSTFLPISTMMFFANQGPKAGEVDRTACKGRARAPENGTEPDRSVTIRVGRVDARKSRCHAGQNAALLVLHRAADAATLHWAGPRRHEPRTKASAAVIRLMFPFR